LQPGRAALDGANRDRDCAVLSSILNMAIAKRRKIVVNVQGQQRTVDATA
jgi:hypothetical protein